MYFVKRHQSGAFFTLSSSNVPFEELTKRVQSLTITERMMGMSTGSVTFRDSDQFLSDHVVEGGLINIEWGYKDVGHTIQAITPNPSSPTDIKGPAFKSGMTGILGSSSCDADDKGEGTYTISFKSGLGLISNKRSKNYFGPYATIIAQILTLAGVFPAFQYIAFSKMKEVATLSPLKQSNETDMQFLIRKAEEWGCVFQIGQTMTGQDVAVFADPDKLKFSQFGKITKLGFGVDHVFKYMCGDESNCIKYRCEHDLSQDGTGEIVQFALIGGMPIEGKLQMGEQRVVAYKLDLEKYKKEMTQLVKEKGPGAGITFQTKILKATDFQSAEISRYWTMVEQRTAPSGSGKRVTIKAFGNPLYTPSAKISLGKGFPDRYRRIKNLVMESVIHKLFQGGHYFCDIVGVDFLGLKLGF